ncbi:hypothetical protein VCRA2133E348_170078 [Vibrio crassostreae]|nr:hypothetical protein VCRA2133E348_170071 [Vibrio crassostreae]CAK2713066.1 hypothetical protein VCRA2133E348_170078 [Vibrio crassostreae]
MLITGLVFILKSVISTLGVVLGRISYALGLEVGVVEWSSQWTGVIRWKSSVGIPSTTTAIDLKSG